MKKLSLITLIATMMLITGCGSEIEVSDIPGFDPILNPPTIEQANARMEASSTTIILTDDDCKNGRCRLKANFTNLGGKQARDLSIDFNISAEKIDGMESSFDTSDVDPEGTKTAYFVLYYSGTLSSEKLGTIVLGYSKNSNGERDQTSVEVYKQ